MTMQDLGNLGDLIGGLGVIVSLVYLALQIRQHTKSVRIASFQQAVAGYSQARELLAESDSLADIYRRGCADSASLNANEEIRFRSLIGLQFGHFASALALHEQDALHSSELEPYAELVRSLLATPGGTDFWQQYKRFFGPGLNRWVDGNLYHASRPLPFKQE